MRYYLVELALEPRPQIAVILNDLREATTKFDSGYPSLAVTCYRETFIVRITLIDLLPEPVSAKNNPISLFVFAILLGEKKRGNRLSAVRF